MVNTMLAEETGTATINDRVFCRGDVWCIKAIVVHPAGKHPTGCPINPTMAAIEFRTRAGSRWTGAAEYVQHIGADGSIVSICWKRQGPIDGKFR